MSTNPTCLVSVVFLLAQCSPRITSFYPGSYFPQDRTYQNSPLGFSLSFRGNWKIITDPNEMKANRSNADLLHKTGGELLFIGYTAEQTQGTRGIAINLNETNREYAGEIKKLNSEEPFIDSGLIDTIISDIPMVEWVYERDGFRFVEFFFRADTYNIRIAFWAKPALFSNFLPVYEDMAGSIIIN